MFEWPDTKDIREYVYERNSARHRLSSGGRIMRFLDLHKKQVLDAWEKGKDPKQNGRGNKTVSMKPFSKNSVSVTPISTDDIAERLGVSKNDVIAGIHLLASQAHGGLPDKDQSGRTVIIPSKDEAVVENINRCYGDVLAGKTPIRRWQAALAGRKATEDVARQQTDHAEVIRRSLVGIANALEHWDGLGLDDPKLEGMKKANMILPLWYRMMGKLPFDLARHTLACLNSKYPGLKPASPASAPRKKVDGCK